MSIDKEALKEMNALFSLVASLTNLAVKVSLLKEQKDQHGKFYKPTDVAPLIKRAKELMRQAKEVCGLEDA